MEVIKGFNWLNFHKIPPPKLYMIGLEQQFAEKIHAYTLPRKDHANSRVKDLIDIVLFLKKRKLKIDLCRKALEIVFRARKTHPLPDHLPIPPDRWISPFEKLAKECQIERDMISGFGKVNRFYQQTIACKINF